MALAGLVAAQMSGGNSSVVQPQMDRFMNVSNVVLVEPNWIRNSIYVCIRVLFANLFDVENVAFMHVPFDNVQYSPNASSNVSYFFYIMWSVVCMK